MGAFKPFSSSKYDREIVYRFDNFKGKKKKIKPVVNNCNPDPSNYKIIDKTTIGNYLILLINYPDAKNYEGNKVLLFENVTLSQLEKQGSIDPHFAENKKFFSPIARFEPTQKGWDNACFLATVNTEGWEK